MLSLNEWKIVILRVAHWSNEQGRLLRFLSFDGSIKWKLMINCKDMNKTIMKVSIAMWKSRCLFNISFILHELWSRSMEKEFYSQFSPLPFFFFFGIKHTHSHTRDSAFVFDSLLNLSQIMNNYKYLWF